MEDVTEAFGIVIILLGLIFVAIKLTDSIQSELNFSYDCKNKNKATPILHLWSNNKWYFDRINL